MPRLPPQDPSAPPLDPHQALWCSSVLGTWSLFSSQTLCAWVSSAWNAVPQIILWLVIWVLIQISPPQRGRPFPWPPKWYIPAISRFQLRHLLCVYFRAFSASEPVRPFFSFLLSARMSAPGPLSRTPSVVWHVVCARKSLWMSQWSATPIPGLN